ncbi:unnamed protein product [Schistosoma curassoni]|uniref:Transmembrane protein n=1 Tax=Schistosoma curassoni TaxID=6186 RepID=A0A183JLV4_9TREM|nr:unnamed protein product [Schistosoma curassoni]VDO83753.1 unnamed protein product [Schistosoma curassoni]
MGSRSINLDFILTDELATYLSKVGGLDICSPELKNSISQVLEKRSVVPYSVLNDCYHLTKKLSSTGKDNIYLQFWRISLNTSVVLPAIKQTFKNQGLDAHFEELRNKYNNKCYEKITKDIGTPMVFSTTSKAQKTCFSELKCARKQFVMVLNFIVIVMSAFAFGYFLPNLMPSSYSISLFSRIVCGLLCAVIVMVADFYFLIRNFSLLEKVYG